MFINFTNHASDRWNQDQFDAALLYGPILDLPFPNVSPDSKDISDLGDEYVEKILGLQPAAVLCQGEFSLAFYVVSKLKDAGVKVLTACSERNTVEMVEPDGSTKKIIKFSFVQFREF